MATYKDSQYVTQRNDPRFDRDYTPGSTPDDSGIYRCMGCGREVVAEASRTLPPQNHHQHTSSQGSIRWRLIVCPS